MIFKLGPIKRSKNVDFLKMFLIYKKFFKKLAYTTSLSVLGSLIVTYLGINYGVLKEINPITQTFFEIHYFFPVLMESIIILGISLSAYNIDPVEDLSKITVYGTVLVFFVFTVNFLRELTLLVLGLFLI